MHRLVPFIAGLLFRAGGSDQWKWCPLNQKLWRWLMGAVIGLLAWKGLVAYAVCILSYLIATNLFGYGDKTPILKYLPKGWKFAVSGLMYGLASIPLLGIGLGIAQGLISGACFYGLMLLDDADKLKNPWQEIARGFCGTVLYFI